MQSRRIETELWLSLPIRIAHRPYSLQRVLDELKGDLNYRYTARLVEHFSTRQGSSRGCRQIRDF
jgi:hypothetical protein